MVNEFLIGTAFALGSTKVYLIKKNHEGPSLRKTTTTTPSNIFF